MALFFFYYPTMDPLSALGVACNILAVVDFAWTLLTEAREIYKSDSGRSTNAVFIENLTKSVTDLDKNLVRQPELSDGPRLLVKQSQDLTAELTRALEAIRIKGRHSKWKSFAVALREVWGKGEIKGFTDKLEILQRQIARHILLSTRFVNQFWRLRTYVELILCSQGVNETQDKVGEIAQAINTFEANLSGTALITVKP
jgi:hypothetical protein